MKYRSSKIVVLLCIVAILCIAGIGLILGLTLRHKDYKSSSASDAFTKSLGDDGDSTMTTPESDNSPSTGSGSPSNPTLVPPPQQEAQPPQASTLWAHEESNIPPNPKIRFGKLDNGLRYMILPNDEPSEELSLRMHVDAGSFNEDDDQIG